MACDEKKHLFDKYNRAVDAWVQTVLAFSGKAAMDPADYLIMQSRAEQARVNAQDAKTSYENHVAEHRC